MLGIGHGQDLAVAWVEDLPGQFEQLGGDLGHGARGASETKGHGLFGVHIQAKEGACDLDRAALAIGLAFLRAPLRGRSHVPRRRCSGARSHRPIIVPLTLSPSNWRTPRSREAGSQRCTLVREREGRVSIRAAGRFGPQA